MARVASRFFSYLVILAVAAGLAGPARAQSDKPAPSGQPESSAPSSGAPSTSATGSQAQPTDEIDPLKRSPSDKQKKQQKRALNVELSKTYKKWLNEDVVWIITDQERAAFKQLSNDEERDNFIEQFWLRRDPTPDTEENEYKEEHYRRIAYANEHFAAGIPGWKTDRGRIYIMYGP
ncbi:MAG: GWxTD domain-containing protein, partial [Candidatus Sulfotelmatobacter sp.]